MSFGPGPCPLVQVPDVDPFFPDRGTRRRLRRGSWGRDVGICAGEEVKSRPHLYHRVPLSESPRSHTPSWDPPLSLLLLDDGPLRCLSGQTHVDGLESNGAGKERDL